MSWPIPFRRSGLFAAAGVTLALLTAAPAHAQTGTTVDFNDLPVASAPSGVLYVGNCYQTGGLIFSVMGLDCGASTAFASWGPTQSLYYTGSAALFNNSLASSTVQITATGNRLFSVRSLSLAPVLGALGAPTSVLFTGYLADGTTISQTLMVPAGDLAALSGTLTDFELEGFRNLTSLTYTVTDPEYEPYVQLDNLNVEVVPEPATMSLMGLGLAGLGAMRRRRRRAAGLPDDTPLRA